MTDAIAVWPPGFKITDAADNPIPGAVIEFYDAGTDDARTVYSDHGLTTSLGAIVYTDSTGAPVSASGGVTRVAVYTGTGDFKAVIKDETGVIVETKDNLKGALDTSVFDDPTTALPARPVITKSSDYTVLTTDQGKVINVNCTGGDVTITLPSAVTAADRWEVTVRHVGSANKVILQTVASQTISVPLAGGAAQAFEMVSYGESLTVNSDAANWHTVGSVLGLKLGSGYHSICYDNGTQTGGTLTPDPEEGNFQKLVNGGAFTLEPPTENTNMVLQMTNDASAGAVTTSGFTKTSGDSIATTNGYDYFLHITVVNGFSRVFVEGLQ